jgi:hypothetical protein
MMFAPSIVFALGRADVDDLLAEHAVIVGHEACRLRVNLLNSHFAGFI